MVGGLSARKTWRASQSGEEGKRHLLSRLSNYALAPSQKTLRRAQATRNVTLVATPTLVPLPAES